MLPQLSLAAFEYLELLRRCWRAPEAEAPGLAVQLVESVHSMLLLLGELQRGVPLRGRYGGVAPAFPIPPLEAACAQRVLSSELAAVETAEVTLTRTAASLSGRLAEQQRSERILQQEAERDEREIVQLHHALEQAHAERASQPAASDAPAAELRAILHDAEERRLAAVSAVEALRARGGVAAATAAATPLALLPPPFEGSAGPHALDAPWPGQAAMAATTPLLSSTPAWGASSLLESAAVPPWPGSEAEAFMARREGMLLRAKDDEREAALHAQVRCPGAIVRAPNEPAPT